MQTNVLVVGAGPVGLTAAIELTRYGVPVRVFDKRAERSTQSKALAIWSRTLELLDGAGLGAKLAAAGNCVHGVTLMAGAATLARIELDNLETPYPYVVFLPQDATERLLEERLNALGVQVERGVELTGITPLPDRVDAVAVRADGRTETLTVPWLLACDGAHSFVRHALGKPFPGHTVPMDFLLADVHLRGTALPADRLSLFAHADGVLALFPIRDDRFRVIADIGPASDTPSPEPQLDDVQAIVAARGPGGMTAEDPVWITNFRVNERQIEAYRDGRVFFAGDAAHVHSPAGGQGMNTGMHDVINLAWKLALVTANECAAETLLPSYDDERRPVARAVIADTGRLAALMTVRNPVVQSVRNHVVNIVFGIAPLRQEIAGTLAELSITYPHSMLTSTRTHAPAAPGAGTRAPLRPDEPPFSAGARPRFTLFADATPAVTELIRPFPGVLDAEVRTPFAAGGMWLVRPDGYVSVAARSSEPQAVRTFLDGLRPTRAPGSTF